MNSTEFVEAIELVVEDVESDAMKRQLIQPAGRKPDENSKCRNLPVIIYEL